MHIILRYPDGSRIEALLLSRESDRMRIAIPGSKDASELTRAGERWADDDGLKVSVEAMVPEAPRKASAGL